MRIDIRECEYFFKSFFLNNILLRLIKYFISVVPKMFFIFSPGKPPDYPNLLENEKTSTHIFHLFSLLILLNKSLQFIQGHSYFRVLYSNKSKARIWFPEIRKRFFIRCTGLRTQWEVPWSDMDICAH